MSIKQGQVERAIRKSLSVGSELETPSGRGAPFTVNAFDSDEIRLEVGKRGSRIYLKWSELEGVVRYLRERDSGIEIGARNDIRGIPDTLDYYFKQFSQTNRSTYAAAILRDARIVRIIPVIPMKVSLRNEWR